MINILRNSCLNSVFFSNLTLHAKSNIIEAKCSPYMQAHLGNRLFHSAFLRHSVKGNNFSSLYSLNAKKYVVCNPGSQQCRSIFLGKFINWGYEQSAKGLGALPGIWDSFRTSDVVTSLSDLYIWTEGNLGLPWWLTIILCSSLIRSIIYTPSHLYLEKLVAGRENSQLDFEACRLASMRRPRGDMIKHLHEQRQWLVKEYGCQGYKMMMAALWQFSTFIILTTSVRECLLKGGNTGIREALLPWGSAIGFPDTMFILPIANVILNLLIVEVEAMRMSRLSEDLKMVYKRAGSKQNVLDTLSRSYVLMNFKRGLFLFFFLVYISLPSGINLLWTTMLFYTLIIRLAIHHPSLRRFLKISHRTYETNQPFTDFVSHLRQYPNKLKHLLK